MKKRVYTACDFDEFAAVWPNLGERTVFFLTDSAAALRGDDLDYAEWRAMTAAATAAAASAASSGTARIVAAADVEVSGASTVDDQIAVGSASVPAASVVSFHVDEHLRHESTEDDLIQQDLLWYAPSEIDHLLGDFRG